MEIRLLAVIRMPPVGDTDESDAEQRSPGSRAEIEMKEHHD